MSKALKYPMFDGNKIWEGTSVTIEDGRILSVTECEPKECDNGFLMPGLIDSHTHTESMSQVEQMYKSGIAATCDVHGNQDLIKASTDVQIISSAYMAMGMVLNPKGFVDKCVRAGARYIKVLLFTPESIGKSALCGIVDAAHEEGLKVAAHATALTTVRQAVDAGVDILIHVPMKEEYPVDLAKEIASKGICSAPTLVMMETFSVSGRNGYEPRDYENARAAVNLLYKSGVKILAATDANSGGFSPAVSFGPSIHREMERLADASGAAIQLA